MFSCVPFAQGVDRFGENCARAVCLTAVNTGIRLNDNVSPKDGDLWPSSLRIHS